MTLHNPAQISTVLICIGLCLAAAYLIITRLRKTPHR